jgi:hypothetical protein
MAGSAGTIAGSGGVLDPTQLGGAGNLAFRTPAFFANRFSGRGPTPDVPNPLLMSQSQPGDSEDNLKRAVMRAVGAQ